MGTVDDVLELAGIEPESVASAASVYQKDGFVSADEDLLHFPVADGAFSGLFGAGWVKPEGTDELF
ncbi:hypothetical protein ES707_17382 [subsurface metagenome]